MEMIFGNSDCPFNMPRKFSFEEVRDYFLEHNCVPLFTEYVNSKTNLPFRCSCGEEYAITFASFKLGARCKKCRYKKMTHTSLGEDSYDRMIRTFQTHGIDVITTRENYVNSSTLLELICQARQHTFSQTRNVLLTCIREKRGLCTNCNIIEASNRVEQSFVSSLESKGGKLLSYDSRSRIVRYRCHCGQTATTHDTNLQKWTCCKVCHAKNNPFFSSETQERIKRSNFERYGVENVMHVPSIMSKNLRQRFRKKEFCLPSGKIVTLQGYEGLCLSALLKEYGEEEIETKLEKIPVVKYMFEKRNRCYYPDFFIPSGNLLIEVKSTFTFIRDLEKNKAKFQACADVGFRLHVYIYDSHETLTTRLRYESPKLMIHEDHLTATEIEFIG